MRHRECVLNVCKECNDDCSNMAHPPTSMPSPTISQLELQRESLIADRQQFHKEQLKAQELRSLQSPTLTLAPQTPLQLTPITSKPPVSLHREPMEPPTLSSSGGDKETGSHLETLPASKQGDESGMGMNVPPEMWSTLAGETTRSPQKVSGPALGDRLPIESPQEASAMDVTSVPPDAGMYNPVTEGGAGVKEACPDMQQSVAATVQDVEGAWTGGSAGGEQTGNWDEQNESGSRGQTGSGDQDAVITQTGSGDQTGNEDGERSGSEHPARDDEEFPQPMEATGSGYVPQIVNVDIAQTGPGTIEESGSEDVESTENRTEALDVQQGTKIQAEQQTGNENEENGSGDAACAAPEVQQETEGDEPAAKGWEGVEQ